MQFYLGLVLSRTITSGATALRSRTFRPSGRILSTSRSFIGTCLRFTFFIWTFFSVAGFFFIGSGFIIPGLFGTLFRTIIGTVRLRICRGFFICFCFRFLLGFFFIEIFLIVLWYDIFRSPGLWLFFGVFLFRFFFLFLPAFFLQGTQLHHLKHASRQKSTCQLHL